MTSLKQKLLAELELYKNSFVSNFINNTKLTFLLGFSIILSGIYAVSVIPKESAPNIEFGIVNISTPYSGVSASDIDSLITQKIESKIQSISSIKKYTATSQSGISNITIEFEPGVDMVKGVSDIRSKIDEAKSELPSDLDADPNITEIDSSIQPFIEVIISGPYSQKELSEISEKLKLQLESISEVATVNLSGNADTEFHINIDKTKLESYGLTLSDVQAAIRSTHRDTPLGEIEINNLEYTLRFQGKLESIQDIKEVSVKRLGDTSSTTLVQIEDVAKVIETSKDINSMYRYAAQGDNPMPAIVFSIAKAKSGDIFAADSAVKETVEQFAAMQFLPEMSYAFTNESSKVMEQDFENLFQNMTMSVIIVLLLIFLFIGFRQGLIAALVIPLSFLATIAGLYFSDKTLNFMTNFSMILALGILVDTAIVMVEGATDFIKKGFTPKQAAVLSFLEFRAPLISGMSTTLAVFLVLFFLPGIMGKYLAYIPITVTYVLVFALFISLFLISSYSGILLKTKKEIDESPELQEKLQQREDPVNKQEKSSGVEGFFEKGIEKYKQWLYFLIESRARRWVVFLLVLALFFASFFLPSKFEMMPSADGESITITIEKPVGTRSENTLLEVQKIENMLLSDEYPEIGKIITKINGNTADIFVALLPINERKDAEMRTAKALEYEWTEALPSLTQEEFKIVGEAKGPGSESPVGFRIIMDDITFLPEGEKVAEQLVEIIKETEGTQGVYDNITQIPGEIRFSVDREKALKLGIAPETVSDIIRTAVYGSTVATISRGKQDIDIVIQYDNSEIRSIEDIKDISVGDNIPLSSVASTSNETALSEIHRYNGKLMFRVSSFLTKEGNTAEITAEVLQKLEEGAIPLPQGLRIEDASENAENEELMSAFAALGTMAILIMFIILVIQFNSFSQPLLILQTILFAQIGVAIGLFLTDTPKSLAYILGIISLSGIVVNDAIIMVDQMNKNIRSNRFTNRFEAIAKAGSSRFIPVVLTTLTTSAGIIPLIFIDAFWAGLAYTIVFGLMVSTFMTLFLIPIGYTLFWKRGVKEG